MRINRTVKRWIKPEVLTQHPYRVKSPDYRIKLNQNESPWDWPADLKQEIADRLAKTHWNRYPNLNPLGLREKLGNVLKLSPAQIVVGNGSNEILQALTTVILRRGDVACTLSPTFAVYRLLVEQRSSNIVESFLDDRFSLDTDDLLIKSQSARMTILCNPNTPTGTLIRLDLIEQVAGNADGVVIIDEAYVDYSGVTALPLLERNPNLIITRTFSKAFALASFRVGYAVMAPALAEEVQKGLLPFNLDLPSIIAAEVLLDYASLVQERSQKIVVERDRLIANLNELKGVRAWHSHSNFFLIQTPMAPETMFNKLAEQGILVRDVSGYYNCNNMLRITVGTPDENRELLQAIKTILKKISGNPKSER